MTQLALFALGAALGFAAGAVWVRGRPQPEPPPPPAPEPDPRTGELVVRGIEAPRELWARAEDWIRLGTSDGQNYTPWARDEDGEPDSFGFPLVVDWARRHGEASEIRPLLDAWTEACIAASQVAWVLEIPAGDQLLAAWARRAPPTEQPEADFARWLVGELGRAGRSGLVDRAAAEVRGPVTRTVHRAAASLVGTLAPGLELEVEPPPGVGPRQRETWLVDEALAERLGNPAVAGVVHPVVVLRPLLRDGDRVVLEGEVA